MEYELIFVLGYFNTVTFLGLAAVGFLLFSLRWIGRRLIRRWYRWEDGTFLVASLLTFLIYALGWTEPEIIHTFADDDGGSVLKLTAGAARWIFAMQFLTVLILPLYKISLLANYRRLFEPAPSMRVIYGSLAFIGLTTFVAFIMIFAQCRPLSNFLNSQPMQQCLDHGQLGLLIPELLASCLVVALPLFYVRGVQWRGSTITCAGFLVLFSLYTFVVAVLLVTVSAESFGVMHLWRLYSTGLSPLLFAYMCLCCVPNMHPIFSRRARAAARAPVIRLETSPGGDLVPLKPLQRTHSEE